MSCASPSPNGRGSNTALTSSGSSISTSGLLCTWTSACFKEMVAREDGRVLITSSIASTMPGPFQGVYNASKSFLQSFTEALQNELKDTKVIMTSLMPGPTDTNFFHRANMDYTKIGQGPKDNPAQVAKQGFGFSVS